MLSNAPSNREREILSLIAKGLTNKEIAGLLGLAEGTIKTHMTRILLKLDADDRTQAVIIALKAGYIQVEGLVTTQQQGIAYEYPNI